MANQLKKKMLLINNFFKISSLKLIDEIYFFLVIKNNAKLPQN